VVVLAQAADAKTVKALLNNSLASDFPLQTYRIVKLFFFFPWDNNKKTKQKKSYVKHKWK